MRRITPIAGILAASMIIGCITFANGRITASAACPKVVLLSQTALPYSLYFTENNGNPRLSVLQNAQVKALDTPIGRYDALRISPDGRRLLYFGSPDATSNSLGQLALLVYALPIQGAPENAAELPYSGRWPVKGYLGWLDNETVRIEPDSDQTVLINITTKARNTIRWPSIDDLWNNTAWGQLHFSRDLTYFIYPANTASEGVPSPRDGLSNIHFAVTAKPDTRYDLIPGYMGTILWQEDNQAFMFEADNYAWYRVNIATLTARAPSSLNSDSLSEFHKGVGALLEFPSLAPNNEMLAATAYLPNEQLSTLLILQSTGQTVDVCLHGSYQVQPSNTGLETALWTPDGSAVAFAVVTNDSAKIYIFDVKNNTLAEGYTFQNTTPIELVGWGK
jgi:hypothetical protein